MLDPPDYQLTLRPLPSDVPAEVRLKRLLKCLFRAYQFRVVQAREVPGVSPALPDAAEAKPGGLAGIPREG